MPSGDYISRALGAETGGQFVHARPGDLQIITTYYTRGAIVKLASHGAEKARHKFVIEQKRGRFTIRTAGQVWDKLRRAYVPAMSTVAEASTLAQAIEYAERECERIRLSLLGGSDASDSGE